MPRVTYRWSRAGEEHERTHVGSSLVAQSTGGIEKSTDTV